jgi:hypothetical protein
MLRRIESLGLAAVVCGLMFVLSADESKAQGPAVVTTYYPAQPVVSYIPERRGLFGWRIGYRPVVSYAAPAVSAVAAPVTTYYAPSPTVTTYYAPPAPIVAAPAPVTTYYAPPAPVVAAPAPVTTYYAPPAPVVAAPAPVTVRYAPAPVVTYYPPLIVP